MEGSKVLGLADGVFDWSANIGEDDGSLTKMGDEDGTSLLGTADGNSDGEKVAGATVSFNRLGAAEAVRLGIIGDGEGEKVSFTEGPIDVSFELVGAIDEGKNV